MNRHRQPSVPAPRRLTRRGVGLALGGVALAGAYTTAYAGLRVIAGGDPPPEPRPEAAAPPGGGSTGYFPLPAGLARLPYDPAAPAGGAAPFRQRGTAIDALRAHGCLTTAIYYEAASESEDGQRAVAQVVLNRVRHPAFPASVCGVVFQGSERGTGCQFSFTCDGAMARAPSREGWARASRIARAALGGAVHAPVGLATHYHTRSVSPFWAPSLTRIGVVGAHVFYRWPGGAGTAPAFRQAYAGGEPMPGPAPRAFAQPLRAVATAAPAPLLPAIAPRPEPAPADLFRADALPESQIRPEWADSGKPIAR